MTDFGYWNPYFADNKYPCYVRDIQSEAILYANEEFFKAFHCDATIIGTKFHEVVHLDEVSYDHIKDCLAQEKDYEFGFYHETIPYRGHAHLIRDNKSIFCQCRILLHSDNALEAALTRCVQIYQQPQETILYALMELLCEFYRSERAYVYRFHHDNATINCIAQWCQDPNYSVIGEIGTKINPSVLIKWIETESQNGIVRADSEHPDFVHSSTIDQVLSTFKMRNLTLCTVQDVNQKIVGMVGLSNQENAQSFFDPRLLHTISRFVAQDVSKSDLDATLFHLHHRDILTGLYNRVGYAQRVDKMLGESPESFGVISANVNGLKYINETYGIASGDQHIKDASERLSSFFHYEFFRMSGDELLGLAPHISKEEFEEKVQELYSFMKSEDNYDFSFGHAWAEKNFELTKLIFEAETIMYINKQEYYANSDRKFDGVTDRTLSDLLSYLENDEFMIYLQPQVHLCDGSLYGAEALIRRFDKKNQKMVFPDQFIPLYEQKSVIRHVDMFVVDAVCKLLADWEKQGNAVPFSVNLSRVTLQEYGIVDSIVEICDKYSLPHHLLVIEVTERVGLIENNVASALITSFKDNGFHISLDDFGCAYSNIITLAQIEVDEVKIDKSLVDDLTTDKKNKILVKNMLSMCNELDNTSTLAEGIENQEQATLLFELGCQLGQGYFYARPMPVADFITTFLSPTTK